MKVDSTSKCFARGKYAGVCVEIDLDLLVVSSVLVGGSWQKVAYEGLHLLCTSCHRYGHSSSSCPSPQDKPANSTYEDTPSSAVTPACEPSPPKSIVGKYIENAMNPADSTTVNLEVSAMEHDTNVNTDNSASFPPQPAGGGWIKVVRKKYNGLKKDYGAAGNPITTHMGSVHRIPGPRFLQRPSLVVEKHDKSSDQDNVHPESSLRSK